MATSDPVLLRDIVDRLWRLKPKRVLDVGMGFGKVGFLVREYLDVYLKRHYQKTEWQTVVDGIEAWKPFVTDVHRHLYNGIYIGNALDILPGLGHYDLIFCLDVIEHLSKEDGRRLLDLMRRHGKTVIVSTPKDFFAQGDICGNPHERHLSHWKPKELGGTSTVSGPLVIAEIAGNGKAVHFVTEASPGWAIYPLCADIAPFLEDHGYTVHWYAWDNQEDMRRAKKLVEDQPETRLYVSTGPAAEEIHRQWGIPRKNMYFIFHALADIEELKVQHEQKRACPGDERLTLAEGTLNSWPDPLFCSICNEYAAVGYISEEMGRVLAAKGYLSIHVPQYVDASKWRRERVESDTLRVGVAFNAYTHASPKGYDLLLSIIERIEQEDGMVFDSRALKTPENRGLSSAEMPDFYAGIDVLLCTSKLEGGPLAPLQAAAAGVPTISTKCGHMPEFVKHGETGYLVESTADAFMQKLLYLRANRQALKEMGLAAQKHVETEWSPAAKGEGWLKLLAAADTPFTPPGTTTPPDKPRLHLPGMPHTQGKWQESSCAYTQKTLKASKMFLDLGYEVIYYGCEGNDAEATENVAVIENDFRLKFYPDDWQRRQFKFDQQDACYRTFQRNAAAEIAKRLTGRDFLLCQWGWAHQPIAATLGDVRKGGRVLPVEHGVGYESTFSDFRAFESYAWMHYVYGLRKEVDGRFFDAVIPNYFRPEDFDYCEDKEDYLLYLGRVVKRKGVEIAIEAAAKTGHKLIVAGQPTDSPADFVDTSQPHVQTVGFVGPDERRKLLAKAKALMVPTRYIGPFEGVAIEALLSGTPVICPDQGVFVETIPDGYVGYRCRMFDDYCEAIRHVGDISPKTCRDWAMNFSCENVGKMFDRWFKMLLTLWGRGWYSEGVGNLTWLRKEYPFGQPRD